MALFGGYSEIAKGSPAPVLERVLSSVLKPLLTLLYHREDASWALHLSAYEMEWLEDRHPEVNMLIRDLVHKGRLSVVGGPFYQGILCLLPPRDRTGQIEEETALIRRLYGTRTDSVFLYGQIFSPYYLQTLSLCGMERLFIGSCGDGCAVSGDRPFRMRELDKSLVILPTERNASEATRSYAAGEISFKDYLTDLDALSAKDECVFFLNLDQMAEGGISAEEAGQLFGKLLDHGSRDVSSFDDTREIGYQCDDWYGDDCEKFGVPCFNTLFVRENSLSYMYERYIVLCGLTRALKRPKEVKKQTEKLLAMIGLGPVYIQDANVSTLRLGVRQIFSRYIFDLEQVLWRDSEENLPAEFDWDGDGIREWRVMGESIIALVSPKGGAITECNLLATGTDLASGFIPLAASGERSARYSAGEGRRMPLMSDVLLPPGADLSALVLDGKAPWDLSHELYASPSSDLKKAMITVERKGDVKITKTFRFHRRDVVCVTTLENTSSTRQNGFYGLSCPVAVVPDASGEISVSLHEEGAVKWQNGGDGNVAAGIHAARASGRESVTLFASHSFTLLYENSLVGVRTVLGKEEIPTFTHFIPLWGYDLKLGEIMTIDVMLKIDNRKS